MAHQLSLEALEFLQQESIQAVLSEYRKKYSGNDSLGIASKLAERYTIEERHAILSYLEIVPKFQKKYATDELLLCDQLALEQSTSKNTSSYKANKCSGFKRIADFCCGLGGDSLFLPPEIHVTGVDLSPERIAMFSHNMRALHPKFEAKQADVMQIDLDVDVVFLDPSRRSTENSSRNWNPEDLSPSIPELHTLVERYPTMMIKMSPATPTDLFTFDCSFEFLGEGDECRELLILTGDLNNNNTTTAVNVLTGEAISCDTLEKQKAPHSPQLCTYLYEPYKQVIRSGLIGTLAEQYSLSLIDPMIAYLTSDFLVSHPMLKSYLVLDTCPIGPKNVKKMLKKHDIGHLDIKKRGIRVDPAQEIKKLKAKGSKSGILFYTLQNDIPIIILAQKV